MALITTVYDSANACTIGTYHTYKGECIKVEYIGTEAECFNMVDALIQSDDEYEIVHIVNRVNVRCATPVAHNNPLFTAWLAPVSCTM